MSIHLVCRETPIQVAEFVCQWFVEKVQAAIARRDRCCVSLAGGSTPKQLYQMLAELPKGKIDWSKVHCIWGDERNVPLHHADSNFAMVRASLLKPLGKSGPNVYPVPIEPNDPAKTAEYYESTLRSLLCQPSDHGAIGLDIVLLGLGDDVHTASLFPRTTALTERHRWVVSNWVDKLANHRITLTAPLLSSGRDIAFMVCGAEKAKALHDVWNVAPNPALLPAQLIQPLHGNHLWWMVDQAAIQSVSVPSHFLQEAVG